jgi:Ca2+-transporting ATPase
MITTMKPAIASQPNSPPRAQRAAHALSIEEVLSHYDTHAAHGLHETEVAARRERHGYNVLHEAPPPRWWRRLARQFQDLVILILLAAAILAAITGDWIDAGAILAIVVLNGLLGFFQEERASRALAALRLLSAPRAKVIRSGKIQIIPARELVPGDRVELEAGDHVPADARLIQSAAFHTQEASLTGESLPVRKDHRAVHDETTLLADRTNLAHMGTVAAGGMASAVVIATGMATEIGQVAGMLRRHEPELTPLQRRLATLGRVLVGVCLGIVAIIFIMHVLRGGRPRDVLLTAVGLAVSAVPEGLPVVVTIALALGVQRMARRNALVRHLPSVETLGCVTVVCSDKTGTLTRNEITVREVYAAGRRFDVTGAGYATQGEFLLDSHPVALGDHTALRKALLIGQRCNHAHLTSEEGSTGSVVGDPTEVALLVAGAKANLKRPPDLRVIHEIPFDSDRKAMSMVIAEPSREIEMYTKGAPEVILMRCASVLGSTVEPLTEAAREDILQTAQAMAARAMRVLALAYRDVDAEELEYPEERLIFTGLVGMIDPPRDEARHAVQTCLQAGVRPVMITGDHAATAVAIAREIGISSDAHVLSGSELNQLTNDELAERAQSTSVFARVTAEHKLRIVHALRARDEVVAMTGDGVNDAPAVQAADIGIAMGITGTDVTKEASDMVLTDDNFATIVNAIEEGRGIYDNILKFVHYLLASNASELMFVLVAALIGWPVPLLAIQILWINLVSDSLPALALGTEPPEPGLMSRRPRATSEKLISLRRAGIILMHGSLLAAAAVVGFWLFHRRNPDNIHNARTAAFCVVAFSQLFYAFACRSFHRTMPALGLLSNPRLLVGIGLGSLLQIAVVSLPFISPVFAPHSLLQTADWLLIMALALAPVSVIEVSKLLLSLKHRGAES